MSDERDLSDAAADGGETAEGGDTGLRGQTALVTRPAAGPVRPTGKRSRHRSGDGGGAGVDLASGATELLESDADAETEKLKKARPKGQKKAGPSRNRIVYPFVFVYNYLQQVVGELRKVIWPNRKQMVTYTSVVLAFLVFMTALIAGADYGFAKLVLLVFGD